MMARVYQWPTFSPIVALTNMDAPHATLEMEFASFFDFQRN
jgi:hypothetical protein